MKYLSTEKFSFVSDALPPDAFGVINFKGSEGISKIYRFEVLLVSDRPNIDFSEIMNKQARLVFHREDGANAFYNGIIANFEQLQEVNSYALYRAHIVPRLWWLSITHHNQVFLNKTVREFGEAILMDAGFGSGDFEFRLQGAYEPVEYVCQYGESHWNFLSRWFEREGIYYYFEQSEKSEKVIFTDTRIAHIPFPQQKSPIVYSPTSGLESDHLHEVIRSFQCRKNVLPAKVLLKDYNYRRPSLEMTGSAVVDQNGIGTIYSYHEHFRSSEEGNRLAKIRAESIICRGEEYYGESTAPYMLPGFTFTLARHYREGFNREYLVIEVNHEGDQTGLLLPGISFDLNQGKQYYINRLTAIPSATQFRPQVKTMKPQVSGTMVGRIDAEGSGQYAELDDMGRYKVTIPFDLSGRTDGKASSWIRMVQPYGGSNHGMHFPLHKGTEVVLTFVNGDPDRPMIVGAIHNPETPSLVTSANQTANIIQTSGGNKIQIEDQDGQQHIYLHSPTASSTIRLGSGGGGDGGDGGGVGATKKGVFTDWEVLQPVEEGIGIKLATSNWLDISAQFKNEIILGDVNEVVIGGVGDVCIGGRAIISLLAYTDITLGIKHDFVFPKCASFKGKSREVTLEKHEAHERENELATMKREIIAETKTELATEKKVINDRITKVAHTSMQIMDRSTVALNSKIKAVNDELRAINSNVTATTTKVEAMAEKVESTAETVENMGSRVTSVAAHVQEIGTQVEDLGAKVTSAGAITREAPVISDC